MTTVTTALHDSAVSAIEAYDINVLNWDGDCVTSFDLKVLEAAQEAVANCTPEERRQLRMGGMRSLLVHADVAEHLYKLKAISVDPGLVAALIIEMHHVVTR